MIFFPTRKSERSKKWSNCCYSVFFFFGSDKISVCVWRVEVFSRCSGVVYRMCQSCNDTEQAAMLEIIDFLQCSECSSRDRVQGQNKWWHLTVDEKTDHAACIQITVEKNGNSQEWGLNRQHLDYKCTPICSVPFRFRPPWHSQYDMILRYHFINLYNKL